MGNQNATKQRSIQAAVVLVILSAWLLIGAAAVLEAGERKSGAAILMIGQGLLVTGFGLAILRALQSGFGALDRFFGAILQRTERPGSAAPGVPGFDEPVLAASGAPPVAHPNELAQQRPAASRVMAANSFARLALEPAADAQRQADIRRAAAETAQQRPAQRSLMAKPIPARAAAKPAPAKSARSAVAEKAPVRPASQARPAAPATSARAPAAAAPVPAPAKAAPAAAAPPPRKVEPVALEEGFLVDRAYRILSDGTVEVETLLGVRAFESLDVAREFIGAPRLRPNGAANEAYSSAA